MSSNKGFEFVYCSKCQLIREVSNERGSVYCSKCLAKLRSENRSSVVLRHVFPKEEQQMDGHDSFGDLKNRLFSECSKEYTLPNISGEDGGADAVMSGTDPEIFVTSVQEAPATSAAEVDSEMEFLICQPHSQQQVEQGGDNMEMLEIDSIQGKEVDYDDRSPLSPEKEQIEGETMDIDQQIGGGDGNRNLEPYSGQVKKSPSEILDIDRYSLLQNGSGRSQMSESSKPSYDKSQGDGDERITLENESILISKRKSENCPSHDIYILSEECEIVNGEIDNGHEEVQKRVNSTTEALADKAGRGPRFIEVNIVLDLSVKFQVTKRGSLLTGSVPGNDEGQSASGNGSGLEANVSFSKEQLHATLQINESDDFPDPQLEQVMQVEPAKLNSTRIKRIVYMHSSEKQHSPKKQKSYHENITTFSTSESEILQTAGDISDFPSVRPTEFPIESVPGAEPVFESEIFQTAGDISDFPSVRPTEFPIESVPGVEPVFESEIFQTAGDISDFPSVRPTEFPIESVPGVEPVFESEIFQTAGDISDFTSVRPTEFPIESVPGVEPVFQEAAVYASEVFDFVSHNAHITVTPTEDGFDSQNPEISTQLENIPMTFEDRATVSRNESSMETGRNSCIAEQTSLAFLKPSVATKLPDSATNRKFVFCYTRLSRADLGMLRKLSAGCGGRIESSYSDDVTHLVVKLERRRVPQTMKYMFAIAGRKWIVVIGWVEECLRSGKIIDETPFETSNFRKCDIGARKSRLSHSLLFKDLKFHVAGHLKSSGNSREDCKKLLLQLGGNTIETLDARLEGCIVIVVDEDAGANFQELFDSYGWLTITWGWLLDCILSYELLPISPSYLMTNVNGNEVRRAGLPVTLLKLLPT